MDDGDFCLMDENKTIKVLRIDSDTKKMNVVTTLFLQEKDR